MNTLPLHTINSMLDERRRDAATQRLAKAFKAGQPKRDHRTARKARLRPALD